MGVAVNVTELPEQTGFEEAATLTLTGKFGFTVMLIEFEVAGLPVAQEAFEVRTHVTALLFAKVVVVKVLLLVPALVPFTFH